MNVFILENIWWPFGAHLLHVRGLYRGDENRCQDCVHVEYASRFSIGALCELAIV